MSTADNPIDEFLDREAEQLRKSFPAGPIMEMLEFYEIKDSDRLLGFVFEMGYDTMRIITCDAWKQQCGGVPRNSFVIAKANQQGAATQHGLSRPLLIFARISDTALTPVAADIQRTIFQVQKVQAQVDPLTNLELQWGALKAEILGTYYDETDPVTGEVRIAFGNDLDDMRAPHFYAIYVPTDEHLEKLINSFVDTAESISIGRLRYTETETLPKNRQVEVRISPHDFVANRTAIFGKTRGGKSNTLKIILEMMLRALLKVGQLIFDLSGEYTYPDPQTGASIYLAYPDRCVRYSLHPRRPDREVQAAVPPPAMLRANFYEQVELGHAIIQGLFDSYHQRRPDYMAAFFGWEPIDLAELKSRLPEVSDQRRYRRALSMYQALLYEAGFQAGERPGTVPLCLSEVIRLRLADNVNIQKFGVMETKADGTVLLADTQPLGLAVRIYEHLWTLYESSPTNQALFPIGSTGRSYFEPIHVALLRMLGDRSISGARKLTPFSRFHSPDGRNITEAIVEDIQQGLTVLIDLAAADPIVARYYSELIVRALLAKQMAKFSMLEPEVFEQDSVLVFIEESHRLFRSDDNDLSSIWNVLAKEGAKFRTGLVYTTQSMSTLSPDLIKNTDNIILAHLSDSREIQEVERRYEFRGVGLEVQRTRTKGYVRAIFLSHRYCLPVQIRLFTLK